MHTHEGQIRELVDFDEWRLLMDFEPPNPSLFVDGSTRIPMDVVLEPMKEVVAEPDYWPVEVVGYHPETTTEVVTPYHARASTDDLPRGMKGFELIGQTRRENINYPPTAAT